MSRLETESVPFRKVEVAKNEFDENKPYTNGNPAELSPIGKDTNNGETGSAIDIAQRKKLITKNKFNYNREYNAGTA
jgi:hypothetical protein